MQIVKATTPVLYCDQPGHTVAAVVNRDSDEAGVLELTVFTNNGPAVKHAVRYSLSPMVGLWSHTHRIQAVGAIQPAEPMPPSVPPKVTSKKKTTKKK